MYFWIRWLNLYAYILVELCKLNLRQFCFCYRDVVGVVNSVFYKFKKMENTDKFGNNVQYAEIELVYLISYIRQKVEDVSWHGTFRRNCRE